MERLGKMNLLLYYHQSNNDEAAIIEAQLRRRLTVNRLLDDIIPGGDRKQAMAEMLWNADAILVLLSANALAGNTYYNTLELLLQTEKGVKLLSQRRIFLLVVSSLFWEGDEVLSKLELLISGKPIDKGSKTQNRAEALAELYRKLFARPQLPQPE